MRNFDLARFGKILVVCTEACFSECTHELGASR